jgi:hypothetical protein
MSQERIGGIDRRALPDKTMALRRAHDRNTHLRLQTPDHVALSTLDGHRHGNPDPSHTEGRITHGPHSPRRELAETAVTLRCELMTALSVPRAWSGTGAAALATHHRGGQPQHEFGCHPVEPPREPGCGGRHDQCPTAGHAA